MVAAPVAFYLVLPASQFLDAEQCRQVEVGGGCGTCRACCVLSRRATPFASCVSETVAPELEKTGGRRGRRILRFEANGAFSHAVRVVPVD